MFLHNSDVSLHLAFMLISAHDVNLYIRSKPDAPSFHGVWDLWFMNDLYPGYVVNSDWVVKKKIISDVRLNVR